MKKIKHKGESLENVIRSFLELTLFNAPSWNIVGGECGCGRKIIVMVEMREGDTGGNFPFSFYCEACNKKIDIGGFSKEEEFERLVGNV